MTSTPFSPTLESSAHAHFSSSATTLTRTGELYSRLVVEVAIAVTSSFQAGGKVLTCGNGGSASDAEHIAAEFIGRLRRERRALPAIALTSCTAALTAIGNDYGFDQIFARQIEGHANPGDVLIAISTSGQSPNVLAAVRTAKSLGLFTVGGLARLSDAVFAVPSAITAEIQQCHIAIAHAICETVDELLSASANPTRNK
jgi:D-sedoheptulose 7-phosphate isomerase